MKISIIVTCYNQEVFLEETLNSIAQQTYSDWECIIVDDGSTDNSAQIAKKWLEKDSRFLYVYKENGGVSKARNLGISKVTGDFIQFLDGDDTLESTKLEESIKLFLSNRCDIIVSNFYEIKDNEKRPPFCDLTKYEFTYKNILLRWDIDFNIPIHCFLFTKSIIGDSTFEESILAKEDWVMWIKIFRKNPKVLFINQPLVMYRIPAQSTTKNKELMERNTEKVLSYILKNETLYFDAFFMKIINHYKEKIHKIQSRPWYKKVFYALIGRE